MATSGTRNFTPKFADMMSEAFSNCLIRSANVTQDHIEEVIRSADLMLIKFGNRGVNQYQLTEFAITLASGTATYNLPAGTDDVWSAILRQDNSDTPVWPMARTDYHALPNKTAAGDPFNFTVSTEAVGDATRTITLWPVPTASDQLRLWLWCQPEAVTKMNQTLSVGKKWYDAYAMELSWRMAMKFAPAREERLEQLAEQAFILASQSSRERRDLRIRARGGMRPGRIV